MLFLVTQFYATSDLNYTASVVIYLVAFSYRPNINLYFEEGIFLPSVINNLII